MKIKPFISLTFSLAAMTSSAIVVDNICYDLSDNEATVIAPAEGEPAYSGAVIIPETISDGNGNSFTVTAIGQRAFYGADQLSAVILPHSIVTIESEAFAESSIKKLNAADCSSLLLVPPAMCKNCFELTEVLLPRSIEYISEWAFSATKINDLILPENLVGIGYAGFMGAPLERLEMNSLLSTIGELAFHGATLKHVKWSANLTFIGFYAFRGAGAEEIVLPASIEQLKPFAFQDMSSLQQVICHNPDPTAINAEEYLFFETDISRCTLYVPETSIEAYATTKPWSEFKEIKAIDYSGLDETITENRYATAIYDLRGNAVWSGPAEAIESFGLLPGIYLIRTGNRVQKLRI